MREDDATLSELYWQWYLASYLLTKGAASALYISPVFADAPADRQHTVTMTYGMVPWYLPRYDAASAIGAPAGPIVWVGANASAGVATREYTGGFVVANPQPLGTASVKIPLPAGKTYRVVDSKGGATTEGHVLVNARNATVLLLA